MKSTRLVIAATLGLMVAPSLATPQAPVVPITIVRKVVQNQCTMGDLRVGDRFLGYTLERPPIGNINYISSIPRGTYPAFIRADGNRGWRIELRDVPGRDKVQIHIGNQVEDTVGCILLGSRATVSECTVHDSGSAMRNLRRVLEDELRWQGPQSEMRVTIACEGAGCRES